MKGGKGPMLLRGRRKLVMKLSTTKMNQARMLHQRAKMQEPRGEQTGKRVRTLPIDTDLFRSAAAPARAVAGA
jgi:hypothetical protein